MSFQIEFLGLDEFTALMRKGPEIVKEEMLTGINRLTLQGQAISQKEAPFDTGNLRRSITTQKATFAGGEARGSWGTNVPYAKFAEDGRSAGKMPPAGALLGWMGRHGADAKAEFIIRRAIGRKGTTGKKYMEKGRQQIEPKVQAEFRAIALRIIARMGGG
jgi:hypothetical protein